MIERRSNRRARNGRKTSKNVLFVFQNCTFRFCDYTPDGNSYDKRIMIENGVCKLKDGSAIAGSCATMDRLIRTVVKDAGIPLEDAVRMASETPALVMGVYDRKGSICKHKDADIIVMDKNLNLTHVIAMGEIVSI